MTSSINNSSINPVNNSSNEEWESFNISELKDVNANGRLPTGERIINTICKKKLLSNHINEQFKHAVSQDALQRKQTYQDYTKQYMYIHEVRGNGDCGLLSFATGLLYHILSSPDQKASDTIDLINRLMVGLAPNDNLDQTKDIINKLNTLISNGSNIDLIKKINVQLLVLQQEYITDKDATSAIEKLETCINELEKNSSNQEAQDTIQLVKLQILKKQIQLDITEVIGLLNSLKSNNNQTYLEDGILTNNSLMLAFSRIIRAIGRQQFLTVMKTDNEFVLFDDKEKFAEDIISKKNGQEIDIKAYKPLSLIFKLNIHVIDTTNRAKKILYKYPEENNNLADIAIVREPNHFNLLLPERKSSPQINHSFPTKPNSPDIYQNINLPPPPSETNRVLIKTKNNILKTVILNVLQKIGDFFLRIYLFLKTLFFHSK